MTWQTPARDQRRRLFLHRRDGVRVRVQGDRDGGVAEALGDDAVLSARGVGEAPTWTDAGPSLAHGFVVLPKVLSMPALELLVGRPHRLLLVARRMSTRTMPVVSIRAR